MQYLCRDNWSGETLGDEREAVICGFLSGSRVNCTVSAENGAGRSESAAAVTYTDVEGNWIITG